MQDVNMPCSSVFLNCKPSSNYWYTSTSGTFKLSPEIGRKQKQQRASVHIHISVLSVLGNGQAGVCFRKLLIDKGSHPTLSLVSKNGIRTDYPLGKYIPPNVTCKDKPKNRGVSSVYVLTDDPEGLLEGLVNHSTAPFDEGCGMVHNVCDSLTLHKLGPFIGKKLANT